MATDTYTSKAAPRSKKQSSELFRPANINNVSVQMSITTRVNVSRYYITSTIVSLPKLHELSKCNFTNSRPVLHFIRKDFADIKKVRTRRHYPQIIFGSKFDNLCFGAEAFLLKNPKILLS